MVMNTKIKIVVTELQSRLIKAKAEELGFRSKSAFARAAILGNDLTLERMVREIYEKVCEK